MSSSSTTPAPRTQTTTTTTARTSVPSVSSSAATASGRGASSVAARGRSRGTGGSAATGAAPTTLPRLSGAPGTASGAVARPRASAAGREAAQSERRGSGGHRAPPLTTSSTNATTGVLTRPQARPNAVVRTLHEQEVGPNVSAKGRAIQEDLRDLADDYFGGVESRAPAPETASAAGGGGGALRPGISEGAFSSNLSRSKAFYTDVAIPAKWTKGPTDSEGRMYDASDSNILCMDVLAPAFAGAARGAAAASKANAVCVVGSADHGLKVFDLATLRERKTLYNKTNGHTDWVTCCRFLPDGRVISGGMDSKLCLWDSVHSGGSMARCQDLLGHTGSVSQVEVNGENHRAVSAGYDRTLRVWDCSSFGREIGVLAGHKAPVMQFDWCGVQVLSGDRQGQAKVWDLERAQCLCTMATKRGQIGAVQLFYHEAAGELTMFGDQGGMLNVLDLRQGKKPICQREVHPGGVVSGIRGVHRGYGESGEEGGGGAAYVVTCGADKTIRVLEPRCDFAPVHSFSEHRDFIYSMEAFGPLVVSGAGNGWVMVHDTRTGECCYGLGAGKNAIREVFCSPQLLVAAGDDGKAVVYNY